MPATASWAGRPRSRHSRRLSQPRGRTASSEWRSRWQSVPAPAVVPSALDTGTPTPRAPRLTVWRWWWCAGCAGRSPARRRLPPRDAQAAAVDDKVLPRLRAAHRVENSGHHCAHLVSRAGASGTRARAGALTHRCIGCSTSVVFRRVAHIRICLVPRQEPGHLPRAVSPRMSIMAPVDPTVLRHLLVDWLLQWTFGRQCLEWHPMTATTVSECRQRE